MAALSVNPTMKLMNKTNQNVLLDFQVTQENTKQEHVLLINQIMVKNVLTAIINHHTLCHHPMERHV
jgi:alpha-glucuronidase